MNALDKAISLFKSKSEMASKLGYSSSMTIRQWQNRGRIPPTAAAKIEKLTHGKVTIRDLCPHLYEDAA